MNGEDQLEVVRGIQRVVFIILALLFLALGLVGVVLPVLPTTPFLLLMSYFLIRSSPWLYRRVVGLPLVGGPIRDWREHRGVRRHVKCLAYTMVFAVVVVSLWTSTGLAVKLATISLAAVGQAVIWRLPVIK